MTARSRPATRRPVTGFLALTILLVGSALLCLGAARVRCAAAMTSETGHSARSAAMGMVVDRALSAAAQCALPW